MRYAFVVAIMFVCGVACGTEAASAPSVLNHSQPAVAVAAPEAPAPVAAPTAAACECASETRAANTAACCRRVSRARVRTVTEGCDTCTGQSVRSVTRSVVRGPGAVSAVVDRVGDAAVNVITLPRRVCRNGRCERN